MIEKSCTKCQEVKPLTEFDKQKSGKYGRRSHCKSCREAYRKSPEGRREQKNRNLKREFDINLSQYEVLYDRQKGKCAICGTKTKLVVDHCHNSLDVRGLLCSTCNLGLGHFHDNVYKLTQAIQYLIKTDSCKGDGK